MLAVVVQNGFGVENLVAVERPEKAPAMGEVKVRIHASSLNYRDLMMVRGEYNPKQALPLVPCSDAAGEVVEVGPGVKSLAVGQKVVSLFAPAWQGGGPERDKVRSTLGGPADGGLQTFMTMPATAFVPMPAHLSFEEGATLTCAGLTAWSALVTLGNIKAGDTVLIQGSGGVSLFALQLARMHGARVIALSSSDEKLARMRALGAEHTINYRQNPKWGRAVLEYTGQGVDHVVEVGGAGTFEQSMIAVRIGGNVYVIGVLGGAAAPLSVTPILMKQVRVQGVLVGNREGHEAMHRAISAHQMHPVLDRTFELSQIQEAFRYMASGQHFGKIAIRI